MIVRGLIAVLIAMVSGQAVTAIRDLNIREELARLKLDQALSAQRSNGLRAMVTRIEDIAGASATT
jgi:cysteine desulfuration protein SufE